MFASTTKAFTLALSAATLFNTARAIGDFPCAGTAESTSCSDGSTNPNRQFNISATATCQPDPINPSVSYCGYAAAACSTNADCDYGSCGSDGKCKGYAGDPCPNGNTDCQAFFFCGTDGTCGGTDAGCNNGDPTSPIPSPDQQCASNSCNLLSKKCNAVPSGGMAAGAACGTASLCSSNTCSNNLCVAAAAVPQISAGGGSNGRRQRRHAHQCARGLTACHVNTRKGFECLDVKSNLESCGGCLGYGGQDCTAIAGVEGVACQNGACKVLSCTGGMQPSRDGKSCV